MYGVTPYNASPQMPGSPGVPVSDPAGTAALPGMDELTNLFAGLRDSMGQRNASLESVFNDMLSQSQSTPMPTDIPTPGPVNPLQAMAATFGGILSSQLSGMPQTAQNVQNTLNQRGQERSTIERANIMRRDEVIQQRQMDRLKTLGAIAEHKAAQAKELGDLDQFEAQTKAQYTIQSNLKKLEQEAQDRRLKTRGGQILDQISARGKFSTEAARIAAAAKVHAQEIVSKFKDPRVVAAMKQANEQADLLYNEARLKAMQRDAAGEPFLDQDQIDLLFQSTHAKVKSIYDDLINSLPATDAAGGYNPPAPAPPAPAAPAAPAAPPANNDPDGLRSLIGKKR